MEHKIKRPISIWITQIVLTLTAGFMLLYIAYGSLISVSEGKPPPLSEYLFWLLPLVFVVALELLSVVILAFGKWVGRYLACLALVIQTSLLILAVFPFQNDWRDVLFSVVVIASPPLLLVASLVFSRKVTEFVAPPKVGSSTEVLPTPPPSFES